MPTIAFDTLQEADARSRAWWAAILGRKKYPQDVTEYLYGRTGTEQGDVAVVVPERDEYLDTLLRLDQMTADEIAALVSLYPDWSGDSVDYGEGDIVAYGGTLYRIVTPHTSQGSWAPDVAPALWEPCAPDGVIPEWQQPTGAHNSYPLGAKVTYDGKVWESTVDANTWQPGVFGWIVVGDDGGEEPSEPDAWQAGVSYAVDDEVTYDGATYRCVQAHTSQVGWTPVAVPALWQLVE